MQIRATCKGTCEKKARFSKVGYTKYHGLCRPCYKASHGRRRPITGRTRRIRNNSKPVKTVQQQKGKR